MLIDIVSQLVSASVRVCGLALVTFVSLTLFRIRSSGARHAMWTVVLVGMLLEIPLGVVAPVVMLEALPILSAPVEPRVMESAGTSRAAAQALAPASHTRQAVTLTRVSWRTTLTGIYLAISLLLFFRLVFGCWGLHKIFRGSTPIPRLGTDVFESTRVVVPGSVGCFRARVLLPRAWRDWDTWKLGAVLAHERAHIQRHDWLTHLASHVNVCIFWFHPLAWWIERELARLAEEACDDVALFETKDRGEYAATLVDIAHTAAANGGVLSWPVISMATDSNVTRRVNRILKRTFQISKPFSRLAWASLVLWSAPVIYLSAAVSVTPVRRDSITLKHAPVPDRRAEAVRQPLLQDEKAPGLLADVVSNHNLRSSTPPVRSQHDERPLAICILLDTSGSMYEKRDEVMAAALALVQASKPHDEVCIVGFDDEVFNALPGGEDFTSNIEEMEEALTRIDSRGGKAMRDAAQTGLEHLGRTSHHERRVLVLISEGYDTSSKVGQEELLRKIKSSGVAVYCIGLLAESDPQRQETARLALDQLADVSGGLAFYPKNVAEAESISHQIANKVGNR
jgi:Mg-chelatase subunit ChlD